MANVTKCMLYDCLLFRVFGRCRCWPKITFRVILRRWDRETIGYPSPTETILNICFLFVFMPARIFIVVEAFYKSAQHVGHDVRDTKLDAMGSASINTDLPNS
jgi:hypothetical protein